MKTHLLAAVLCLCCTGAFASNHIRVPFPGMTPSAVGPTVPTGVAPNTPVAEPGKVPVLSVVSQVDFGSGPTDNFFFESISIRNSGKAPLTINYLVAPSGGNYSFRLNNSDCFEGVVIPEGGSCTLNVRMSSPRAGTIFDSFRIETDGGNAEVALTANVIE